MNRAVVGGGVGFHWGWGRGGGGCGGCGGGCGGCGGCGRGARLKGWDGVCEV